MDIKSIVSSYAASNMVRLGSDDSDDTVKIKDQSLRLKVQNSKLIQVCKAQELKL